MHENSIQNETKNTQFFCGRDGLTLFNSKPTNHRFSADSDGCSAYIRKNIHYKLVWFFVLIIVFFGS